jgi:hypothetical protein
MSRLTRRIVPVLLLVLAGCTYSVHQVHVSDFDPGVEKSRGRMIEAKTDQFVILSFAFNTDYVGKAYEKLMAECKGGRIQGITTQYSTSHGFFSWTNKILMKGLCVK